MKSSHAETFKEFYKEVKIEHKERTNKIYINSSLNRQIGPDYKGK